MKTALREAVEQVIDKRCTTALPSKREAFIMSPRDSIVYATELSLSARMVWIGLSGFADGNGLCWPSAATIGKKIGLSERQVWRCLHELEAKRRLLNLGLSNVGTNKYRLIGVQVPTSARIQSEQQGPLAVEDSVTMPNYDIQSPGVCQPVIRTRSIELDSREQEKDRSVDLSATADQPPLSPTASETKTDTAPTDYRRVQDLWNTTCGVAGMPKINGLDGKRKSQVHHLLRVYSLEQLSGLFQKAAASDFLSGRRPSPVHPTWRATFDWLCTEHVLLKISEGDYDNQSGASSPRASTSTVQDSDSCPQTGTAFVEPTPEEIEHNKALIRKLRGELARHMDCSPASDFDGAEDHIHEEQLHPQFHGRLDRPLPPSITKEHAVSPHGSFDNSMDVLHEYNIVPEF
jgi:hypothetical protein